MALFSRTITATSLLVHLLVINLFAARTLYLQGAHASSLGVLQHCVWLFSVLMPRVMHAQDCRMVCRCGIASCCAHCLGRWGC